MPAPARACNYEYDFASEQTAFQWMMIERGHIPEMSPKCHPELAGVGIEYSWGKAKQYFRRKTDHIGRNLRKNTDEAMSDHVLTLARVRKYARKARSYRRAYAGIKEMAHVEIEKHVRKQKTHRGPDRMEVKFLRES